jgi:hypothetical protein
MACNRDIFTLLYYYYYYYYMPRVGFELTIPVFDRAKTNVVLNLAVTMKNHVYVSKLSDL